MRKKRIAFVVNGLYGGGAEKILQVVLRNLDRSRYDITVINHRQEPVNELYPADVTYKSILKSGSPGKFRVKAYNKVNLLVYDHFPPRVFRKLYLRERYDVEIAFIEGYATRIVSGGDSARKIAWVHIDLKSNPWTDIAFRSREEQARCYLRFDCVVSVSESVKESFDVLFRSRRSVAVHNPLDSQKIRGLSSLSDVERPDGPPLFVSAGRLVGQKGYDRLIPIVGRLLAEGFDMRLWIIGEGPDRPQLERMIAAWKLEGAVTLLGFQSNPYPFIRAADWFVCSSRSEGYSTVVAEAQILGIPVVATRCAGMEELLGDDNQWGILVENTDEALREGIINILKDSGLRGRYATRSAAGGERFSLERQMNGICRIIEG